MELSWYYLIPVAIAVVMAIYFSGRKIPMPKWSRKEKVSGEKGGEKKSPKKEWSITNFVLTILVFSILGVFLLGFAGFVYQHWYKKTEQSSKLEDCKKRKLEWRSKTIYVENGVWSDFTGLNADYIKRIEISPKCRVIYRTPSGLLVKDRPGTYRELPGVLTIGNYRFKGDGENGKVVIDFEISVPI